MELERDLKSCPLCGVPIINPLDTVCIEPEKTFADKRDEYKKIDHNFWIKFNSILAAVPIAISLLCNLLYDKKITWSLFVMTGVFMLWTICTSPFVFKRFDYKKMLLTDFTAVSLGLGVIQYVLPQHHWFFTLAFPIILFCLLYWLAAVSLIKKGFLAGLLRIVGTVFVFVTLLVITLEILIDLYTIGSVSLIWSWFVTAACLPIVALMILLDTNKAVKQELARRLHF